MNSLFQKNFWITAKIYSIQDSEDSRILRGLYALLQRRQYDFDWILHITVAKTVGLLLHSPYYNREDSRIWWDCTYYCGEDTLFQHLIWDSNTHPNRSAIVILTCPHAHLGRRNRMVIQEEYHDTKITNPPPFMTTFTSVHVLFISS